VITPQGYEEGADTAAAETAVAVTAVSQPERGSDEAEHELGGLIHTGAGGSAFAAPPARRLNWLV
jgi:hypothetical protein